MDMSFVREIYINHKNIVALNLQPIPYIVSGEVGFSCLNGNAARV